MSDNNLKGSISIRGVSKVYDPGGVNVVAVDNCSLEIAAGEVCMIVGPSGCGKTTLLNFLAKNSQNKNDVIYYESKDINKISKAEYLKETYFILQPDFPQKMIV